MRRLTMMLLILTFFWFPMTSHSGERAVTDTARREGKLLNHIGRVLFSGAGCLRVLTYLQTQKGRSSHALVH